MEKHGDYSSTELRYNPDVQNHPAYLKIAQEKEEIEKTLQSIQSEFTELSEYVNKLEPSYNQSLQYISHIDAIVSNVFSFQKQFRLV